MRKITLTSLFALITNILLSQAPEYVKMTNDSDLNFHTIVNQTHHYYDSLNLDTVKGSGFKQFSRWAKFWSPRTGQVGNNPYSLIPAYQSFAALSTINDICNGGSYNEEWTFIGHNSTDPK